MVERETVERFVDSAERFCSLIEHHQSLTAWKFVCLCAPCLADLYGAAVPLSLLSVEIDSAELIEDAFSTDRAKAIDCEIGDKLGRQRLYWEVFDPREESDPVVGDLGDDLADIYKNAAENPCGLSLGMNVALPFRWQDIRDFRV